MLVPIAWKNEKVKHSSCIWFVYKENKNNTFDCQSDKGIVCLLFQSNFTNQILVLILKVKNNKGERESQWREKNRLRVGIYSWHATRLCFGSVQPCRFIGLALLGCYCLCALGRLAFKRWSRKIRGLCYIQCP